MLEQKGGVTAPPPPPHACPTGGCQPHLVPSAPSTAASPLSVVPAAVVPGTGTGTAGAAPEVVTGTLAGGGGGETGSGADALAGGGGKKDRPMPANASGLVVPLIRCGRFPTSATAVTPSQTQTPAGTALRKAVHTAIASEQAPAVVSVSPAAASQQAVAGEGEHIRSVGVSVPGPPQPHGSTIPPVTTTPGQALPRPPSRRPDVNPKPTGIRTEHIAVVEEGEAAAAEAPPLVIDICSPSSAFPSRDAFPLNDRLRQSSRRAVPSSPYALPTPYVPPAPAVITLSPFVRRGLSEEEMEARMRLLSLSHSQRKFVMKGDSPAHLPAN